MRFFKLTESSSLACVCLITACLKACSCSDNIMNKEKHKQQCWSYTLAVKNEKSFICHSSICVVSEWNVSGRGAANTAPRILSRGGALFCSPPNLPLQESKNMEIKILTRRNSITRIGASL